MTNQDVINAYVSAAVRLGLAEFAIMEHAGVLLSDLRGANGEKVNEPYTGTPLADLPGLTDAERAALLAAASVIAGAGAHSTGRAGGPPVEAGGPALAWEHFAEPGLHGPADPGGGWTDDAFEVVRRSRVRAVKVLVPDVQQSEVDKLRATRPDGNMFIVARLFNDQLGQPRPQGGPRTPEAAGHWFVGEVANEHDRTNPLTRAISANIQFFEVHNEPNTAKEGCRVNWNDGEEFADFFITVRDELRARSRAFGSVLYGFPGLSPGDVNADRPIGVDEFLDQAHKAVDAADFLCCHIYWGAIGSVDDAINDLRAFCLKFPHKRILCTEFSNNSTDPNVSRDEKARQYAEFYRACRTMPANLGGMFAYVLSWRRDEHREGFLEFFVPDPHHPDRGIFRMTSMADTLGRESF